MKKILDFRTRSYSDVISKYQNMEKRLKYQRRLGLGCGRYIVDRKICADDYPSGFILGRGIGGFPFFFERSPLEGGGIFLYRQRRENIKI